MSDSKYSVLFMRDDRDVTRYRINPFWLKMFVFSQVFLLLCAAGGITMGIRGFAINADLQSEKKGLEQRLVDAEVRLERLGNMEKILESYDPNELQSLLTAATSEVEKLEDPKADVDLNKVFTRTDTRLVGVENMQAKIAGSKINVSFELNNLQPSKETVTGQAKFLLIKKDGSALEVSTNKSDLAFQIQRFKRIRTSFVLPDGMKTKDIFGLRLEIRGKDGSVIYAETYPFYHILA